MRLRTWVLLVLAILSVPLLADWAVARSRLGDFVIEASFDPSAVVADGKNGVTLDIRVTENGRPRAHDLVQCWIQDGAGLLIPSWLYTDDNGVGHSTYTPNPYSVYDPQDGAVIVVSDVSLGRLVEVDKRCTATVKLVAPNQ